MANGKQQNTPPGPGIDASGQTVVDPTANVMLILDAAILRQDDLRKCEAAWQRRMNKAESRHIREVMELRGRHTHEMRQAETERIDAIRAVDVGAVASAATVQQTTQNTLAKTVTDSAEALRTQVAASRSEATTTLDAKIAPLASAIADLQRFQFESAGGKQQVVESRSAAADLEPLLQEIRALRSDQNHRQGSQAQVVESRSNNASLWQMVGVVVVALGVFATIIIAVTR